MAVTYEISIDGGAWTNVGTVLTYQVPGLLPNTSYGFRIRTNDGFGNFSSPSQTVTVTTDELLFDSFSTSHMGVWELKKRRYAYSGYAVRAALAADSGATTLDIGFDSNGDVDMAAYAAFGTGSERIVTVYDQSGNGFDFTQSWSTSLCPILRTSSYNGKPCFYFAGGGSRMRVSGFTDWNGLADCHFIQAVKRVTGGAGYPLIGGSGGRIVDWADFTLTGNVAFGESGSARNQFTEWSTGGTIARFQFDGGAGTNALKARMFINGNERTPTATAAHAATFPNETHLDWNGTPLNAGTSCDAEYFAFYYCGQDLTSDQIAAIEAALEADYFTFDDRDIVCEGDSLTYGSGTALPGDTGTDPYPSQLKVLLDADTPYTWHKRNVGVSAQQLGNEIIAAEKGEVLAYRDDWRQTRVVIWAGTNDVAVASGASSSARVDPILAVMTTYVQALTANHFDPIWIKVPNMLPRSDVDVTNANFETDRLYWNSHLAAAVGANGTVIDLASNANLDDEDDTTYYSGDHVHLNATGYGVVADILATAIEADL